MAAIPEPVRLTSLSHGAGCACKLGPDELAAAIELLPAVDDPRLLVGFETADDAAVYRVSDEQAVVLTADFFTPIVDNPFDFGRIAATNALSDVYAMGAVPLLAINLVAFSIRDLGAEPLRQILAGGATVAVAAGVALAGGHSIDDPEPKYGMAVVGIVDPERVLTNAGGKPGDVLVLTKPVGSGLVTTAAKRGLASDEALSAAIETMTELNREAATAALEAQANAVTDVTGFGLSGHLHELCLASSVAAAIEAEQIPAITGALALAADERCVAGGSRRNAMHAEDFVDWNKQVSAERRVLLTDAMTSGGLLIAVPAATAGALDGAVIGELTAGQPGQIAVR